MRAASEIGGEPGPGAGRRRGVRGFADGMGTAFIIGAAALALGAVIVALFLPGPGSRPRGLADGARRRPEPATPSPTARRSARRRGCRRDGATAGHERRRSTAPRGPTGATAVDAPVRAEER